MTLQMMKRKLPNLQKTTKGIGAEARSVTYFHDRSPQPKVYKAERMKPGCKKERISQNFN